MAGGVDGASVEEVSTMTAATSYWGTPEERSAAGGGDDDGAAHSPAPSSDPHVGGEGQAAVGPQIRPRPAIWWPRQHPPALAAEGCRRSSSTRCSCKEGQVALGRQI